MMKTIATVVLSGLIAACATQPPVPTPAAAANPKSPTSAGTVVATSPPAGTTTVAAAPAPDAVNQSYIKRGYRAIHRNGQLLYCQSQVLTGTHFQHTVCLSEAQLRAADMGKDSTLNEIEKGGSLNCMKQCN